MIVCWRMRTPTGRDGGVRRGINEVKCKRDDEWNGLSIGRREREGRRERKKRKEKPNSAKDTKSEEFGAHNVRQRAERDRATKTPQEKYGFQKNDALISCCILSCTVVVCCVG